MLAVVQAGRVASCSPSVVEREGGIGVVGREGVSVLAVVVGLSIVKGISALHRLREERDREVVVAMSKSRSRSR